ncbi:MAG: flagellar export chaperone FliS [bacterium]|nr:flagellar export chaperone FliS [bacterium]
MTKTTEYNKYKQVQIKTASPGKLILLLYQGAIGALKKASELIDQKDYGGKGDCLIKAQDIVMELNMALDMSAGQISASLRQLYLYIYRRLVDANMNLDKEIIREVVTILEDLYGAWEQAVQENEGTGPRQTPTSRLSLTG